MSLQPFATGRSILGGPFVITVTPHAEPPTPTPTPTMADAVTFSVIFWDWIGTDADNAVNVVDYLHERDDEELSMWLDSCDANDYAAMQAGRDYTDWRG